MQIINKILNFYNMSLYLDFLISTNSLLSTAQKIEFILKKYYLILLHLFNIKKFEMGKSMINVLGFDFYYDSQYGLAGLQGILCRHKRELGALTNKKIEVIFDIGANVGTFTILSSMLFSPKKIYSFEPVPTIFSCLEKNTAKLKNVFLNNLAVSNFVGTSYMNFDESNSSISSFSSNSKGVSVSTTTLKDFVNQNNIKKIDLLKIDVESFESLVLDGCGDFLKNVRYLFIEVTIANNENYTISSLFSKLYGDGYNFQLMSYRNASDKSFGEVSWMDCLLKNVDYKN